MKFRPIADQVAEFKAKAENAKRRAANALDENQRQVELRRMEDFERLAKEEEEKRV